MNQQTIKGKWNELRGKVKTKWGQLTEDDLRSVDGGVEQLVGRIQQRTGETREAIEQFFDDVTDEGGDLLAAAGDRIQDAANYVGDKVRDGVAQAEDLVKSRPAQTALVAFGAGIATGLGIAMMLTSHRSREHAEARSMLNSVEQFGKRFVDVVANALPDSLASKLR